MQQRSISNLEEVHLAVAAPDEGCVDVVGNAVEVLADGAGVTVSRFLAFFKG